MRVSERVEALTAGVTTWPAAPTPGSPFAADKELARGASTFGMAQGSLVNSLYHMKVAHQLIVSNVPEAQGTHLLLLRPALLAAARASWLMAPDKAAERVQRAALLLAEDRRYGASAMRKVLDRGAPEAFTAAAELFDRQREEATALALDAGPASLKRPPSEEMLIHDAALTVDLYYGTDDATVDAQLLWNTASGLAHGERWFATLTSGKSRLVAETITERSFDILCSLVNVASLRMLCLCSRPSVLNRTSGE